MKKKDNELATVLIANFNNSKYLKKCLLSVINQSYKNIQIILIDDNSKDKSLKIAKQFEDKVLIIKNKKKTGVGSWDQINAYYLGYLKSKGDVILFLDSDDYFTLKKVNIIMKYFKSYKKKNIVFDLPIFKFANFNKKKIFKQKKFILSSWPRFTPQSCISIRKNYANEIFKIARVKNYPTIWFDFRMAIYSFIKFENINIIKKYLTYYRQSNNSASSKYQKLSVSWWTRRLEAHNFFSLISKKLKKKDPKTLDKILTKIFFKLTKI